MVETFVEVGHHQVKKHGQGAAGDVFLSLKADDGRIIAVLSDGLGSGIKAGVLASLTATMAARFVAEEIPIKRAAAIIMKTLPVCKVRRISYATFTIVDVEPSGLVRIIEYDNPPYALIRKNTLVEPIKTDIGLKRAKRGAADRIEACLHYSEFAAKTGDRLILYSDGVSQSGMGSGVLPFGWTNPRAHSYALSLVDTPASAAARRDDVSARGLARRIVQEATANDAYEPKDDISCGVFYFRQPRRLLVLTGPPIDHSRDAEMVSLFERFDGRKIIAGGTTATIVARGLGREVRMCLAAMDAKVPPASEMDGADLVCEGIITLGKAAELLDHPDAADRGKPNAAVRMTDLFLDSDIIDFVVGMKINEAHQDPAMPVELEIRRNIVKRVAELLEKRYLKKTSVRFL